MKYAKNIGVSYLLKILVSTHKIKDIKISVTNW